MQSSRPLHPYYRLATLVLLVGIVLGLVVNTLLAPPNALAATPAPGVLTPLVLPDYAVQIDNGRTGLTGVCLLCGVSGAAQVIDSNTANNGSIYLAAGLGVSGAIAVRDAANTYPAGYFAGFVVSSGGLLDAQLLSALTIRTYNGGAAQEVRQAGALLNVSIGGGSGKSLVGFVTASPFDEISVSVASLAGVALNLDVHYAAVASVPPAPAITAPASGALLATTLPTIGGTAVANSAVTVQEGSATICATTAGAGGAWSCQPAAALGQGSHSVTATAANVAGTGPASAAVAFTVDTIAPAAPLIASPAAGQATNDAHVPLAGTAEANSTVTVREGASTLCVATAGANGAWSCVPSAALAEGAHSVSAAAADAAGNASAASAPRSFTVDLTAPAAPSVTAPAAGASTNDTTPTFGGAAEPGSAITVSEAGATLCTTAADGNGAWSCAPAAPLAEGPHTAAATSTDAAGNVSPATTRALVVDTTAPTAPTISSPADGGIINTLSPTFSGTAEPGTTITVREGSTTLCTAVTGSNNAWSCTPATPLAQGAHTVSVISTDAADNASPLATVSFQINTAAVSTPSILAPTTGAHINTTTPTFSGTADAGTTVKVKQGSATLCTAATATGGAWSCASAVTLGEGSHTVSAVATNGANTPSSPATRSFVVDVTAPSAAPTISSPTAGSFTTNPRPSIGGDNAEANGSVVVSEGPSTICVASADAGGSWNCAPTVALSEGEHTITAAAADQADNVGPSSAPRSFSVDTQAPPAPTIATPAASAVTNDATPTFSGAAEPNSAVAVREGSAILCNAAADSAGAWGCSPAADLGEGAHTVTASATDAAGNSGPSSPPRSFAIDLTPPAAPVIASPSAGAILNTATPTFAGTAEALSTVTVSAAAVLCTTTADANGAWSCAPGTSLNDGSHTASAVAADQAGNQSAPAARTFTIDTIAPAPPVMNAPAANATMNGADLVFGGTAEPGSIVTVSEGDAALCSAPVEGDSAWSCAPATALLIGAHTVAAVATDAAGNASAPRMDTFTVGPKASGGATIFLPLIRR